jgi:hypothetical protein
LKSKADFDNAVLANLPQIARTQTIMELWKSTQLQWCGPFGNNILNYTRQQRWVTCELQSPTDLEAIEERRVEELEAQRDKVEKIDISKFIIPGDEEQSEDDEVEWGELGDNEEWAQ